MGFFTSDVVNERKPLRWSEINFFLLYGINFRQKIPEVSSFKYHGFIKKYQSRILRTRFKKFGSYELFFKNQTTQSTIVEKNFGINFEFGTFLCSHKRNKT